MIAGGWFIVSVFLNTIFTLLLANVIYLGGMRFVPTEKFQRVMSYAQIVLIAGVTLSYQVVGRLVMYIQMDMMHPELWMYFTPPCYFLSLTSMVKEPADFYDSLSGTLFFGESEYDRGVHSRAGQAGAGKSAICVCLSPDICPEFPPNNGLYAGLANDAG